jgi:hypothetical protein
MTPNFPFTVSLIRHINVAHALANLNSVTWMNGAADQEDLVVIEFVAESVDSRTGLCAYMNMMAASNCQCVCAPAVNINYL